MCATSLALIYVVSCNVGTAGHVEWISAKPGDTVMVTGEVLDIRKTSTGGHLIIKILAPYGLVNVFVPGSCGAAEVSTEVLQGTVITVTGRFEIYNGEPEIVVQSASGLAIG